MALETLSNQVLALRKKIYWLIGIQGFLKIFLLFLILCAATFALDYFLNLPLTVRIVFFIAFIVFNGYSIVKYCIIPLRVPISQEDIVLAIEKANPFLEDRLISAIQFQRLIQDPSYKDSRAMSLKVIEEAERLMDSISWSKILDISSAVKKSILPLAILCLFSLCYSFFPGMDYLTEIWLSRTFFLQDTPWPRKTYIFLLKENFLVPAKEKIPLVVTASFPTASLWYLVESPGIRIWREEKLQQGNKVFSTQLPALEHPMYFYLQSGSTFSSMYKILPSEEEKNEKMLREIAIPFPDYTITKAKGESLFLKIITKGSIPRTSYISYTFGEKFYRLPLVNQGNGFFKYDFSSLTENFTFSLQGGDDQDELPLYHLRILQPPTTESVAVWYHYPEYTKLPSTPWDTPQTQGNIIALSGTNAIVRIKSNIPLKEAKIVFPGKQESIMKDIFLSQNSPDPSLPASPLFWYAKILIQQDARYRCDLLAENGLKDTNPAGFYIRALRDQTPYIQLISPKRKDIDMIPTGSLLLKSKASDDFGISKLAIQYKINRQEWEEIPLLQTHNDVEYGMKEIQSQYLLEMGKIKAKKTLPSGEITQEERALGKGDSISLKIYAKDNSTSGQGGSKESQSIEIDIFEKAELGNLLNEKLKEVKRQLRRISDQQKEKKDTLGRFLFLEDKIETGDIAKILQLRFAQNSISRDITAQSEDTAHIIWTIENNQIWDLFGRDRLETIQKTLQSIASQEKSGQYEGASAQIEKILMDAYQKIRNEPKEGKNLIAEAVSLQDQIIVDLNKIIALLSEWEDFTEVVRDLEQILELQKKMNPQLKKLLDKQ